MLSVNAHPGLGYSRYSQAVGRPRVSVSFGALKPLSEWSRREQGITIGALLSAITLAGTSLVFAVRANNASSPPTTTTTSTSVQTTTSTTIPTTTTTTSTSIPTTTTSSQPPITSTIPTIPTSVQSSTTTAPSKTETLDLTQGRFMNHVDNKEKDVQTYRESQVEKTPQKLTLKLQAIPEQLIKETYEDGTSAVRKVRYVSGRVAYDLNNFTTGRIDIKAKLPAGTGLHPTLWLFPANNQWPPEIDIAEGLGKFSADTGTYHTNLITGNWDNADYSQGKDHPLDYSKEHTFSIVVGDKTLTWYLNGEQIRTEPKPEQLNNRPMQLFVSLAAGQLFESMGQPTTDQAELTVSEIKVTR